LELFEIIQDDPQLPVELLPADWQGPKVARYFGEISEDTGKDTGTVLEGVNRKFCE
jgi:DNA-binding transcriptional regulator PaaX